MVMMSPVFTSQIQYYEQCYKDYEEDESIAQITILKNYTDKFNNILNNIAQYIRSDEWKKIVDKYVDYSEYESLKQKNTELQSEVITHAGVQT